MSYREDSTVFIDWMLCLTELQFTDVHNLTVMPA